MRHYLLFDKMISRADCKTTYTKEDLDLKYKEKIALILRAKFELKKNKNIC